MKKRSMTKNKKKVRKKTTRKGTVSKKYAGLKVIEWIDKQVNSMATIKLPLNATPFMKAFQREFKKMNREEEDIFEKRKGVLFIHHTFLLHELYHRIMATFKFKGQRKSKNHTPSPNILKKLKNIINKCSNMSLASIRVHKLSKRNGGPSIEVMEGGGKGMNGGALLAAVGSYLVAHAKIAAGIGGLYAFTKFCMKTYSQHETVKTVEVKIEKATYDAIRSARAELMKPGLGFTELEINRELAGLEKALRIDYAQMTMACSEMGGELYTHTKKDGETKEACMCDLESARRASAMGSSSNKCENLIEGAISRHKKRTDIVTDPLVINMESVQSALPKGSSQALVVPRNNVRSARNNYDQLRLGHPSLFNDLQEAIRKSKERGDKQINLSDELSQQLINIQPTMGDEDKKWENWSIEIVMDTDSFSSYDPRTILQMYQNLEESMYNMQGLINQAVVREIQLRGSNIVDVATGGNTLGFFESINPFSSARVRRKAMIEARRAYNRERDSVMDLAKNRMEGIRLIRSNLRRAWENILSIVNVAIEQFEQYDFDIQFGIGVAALAYLEPRLLGSLLAKEWAPFLQAPMTQQAMLNLPPPLNSGTYQMPTLQDIKPGGMGKKGKKRKGTRRKKAKGGVTKGTRRKPRGFSVTRTSYSVF